MERVEKVSNKPQKVYMIAGGMTKFVKSNFREDFRLNVKKSFTPMPASFNA